MVQEAKFIESKTNFSWGKLKDNFASIIKSEVPKDVFIGTQNRIHGFEVGRLNDGKNSLYFSQSILQNNVLILSDTSEVENIKNDYNNENIARIFNKNMNDFGFLALTHEPLPFENVLTINQNSDYKIFLDLNNYNYIELVSLFSTLEPEEEDPEERAMWHKKYVDFIMAFSRIIFELGQKEKIDFPFVKNKISFKYLIKVLEENDLSPSGKTIVLKYLKSLPGFEEKNYFISEELHNYLGVKILSSFQRLSEIYTDKPSHDKNYRGQEIRANGQSLKNEEDNKNIDIKKILEGQGKYQIVVYKNSKAAVFFLQEYRIVLDKKVTKILELQEELREKENKDSKDKKDRKFNETTLDLLTPPSILFLNIKSLPKNIEKFISQCNLSHCSIWLSEEQLNENIDPQKYEIKIFFKNASLEVVQKVFPKMEIANQKLFFEQIKHLNEKEAWVQYKEQPFHVIL